MDYKEKYTKETNNTPYCWNGKGEYIQSGSYSDSYVKWIEEQLRITNVVSSFIFILKDKDRKEPLDICKTYSKAYYSKKKFAKMNWNNTYIEKWKVS